MTDLHKTPIVHTLITHSIPEVVRQLECLNQSLERLANLQVLDGSSTPGIRDVQHKGPHNSGIQLVALPPSDADAERQSCSTTSIATTR